MESSPPANQHKFEVINRFLEGDHALIHVNPKSAGVQLPPHLATQVTVTLKISRLFRGFLELAPDKITADLLFGGRYFTCIAPLDAIWGCSSEKGENILWPESTTPEILEKIAGAASQAEAPAAPPRAGKGSRPRSKPSHLKRIK